MPVQSRPVWARGLKQSLPCRSLKLEPSRPVWARGLKQSIVKYNQRLNSRAPCGRVD